MTLAEVEHRRSRFSRRDALVAALLFIGIVGYLVALPHNLNPSDEANYLYDAKRLLNGLVTYRDYFTVITPGFMQLMAALFWVFGTTMTTARAAAAVMQGLIGVLLFLTARRLGVRRGLAWLPALAQVVVAQPAWPIASQHWLSTLLCVALLYVCAGRLRSSVAWYLLPGVILGLLIGVQQQRGLFMAIGTVVWLVADVLLQRRYHRPQAPTLLVQFAALVAGTLLVTVPLAVHMLATAGFDAVWQALVVFPLLNYRSVTHCEWGNINVMTAWQGSFTFPRLLKYLPAVFAVSGPRLVVQWLRRTRPDEVAALTLLLVFSAVSMLSIAYFPDFIHIAFIAPVFFVMFTENLEWATRQLPAPPRLVRTVGYVVGAGILIAGAVRLHDLRLRLQQEFAFSRTTAFGRIDFRTANEAAIYDRLHELLQQTPSRYLFVYPGLSHLYLMLNVENPTPWGFYVASFHGPERLQETLRELTDKQPPYILMLADVVPPDDQLVAWVRQHYDPIDGDGSNPQLIYRRRAGGADG